MADTKYGKKKPGEIKCEWNTRKNKMECTYDGPVYTPPKDTKPTQPKTTDVDDGTVTL